MSKPDETTRVLIADDHPATRRGIRAILEEAQDIEVVGEAENGIEAQELVAKLRPDILLLDLVMPGLRPFEVEKWVRTNYPNTVTLILTAHDRDFYLAEAIQAGVSGFIVKEEKPDRLIDAIRRAAQGDILITQKQLDRASSWRGKVGERWESLTQRERHVVSKRIFGTIDYKIFKMLWRWAKRRHRNKSARWIRAKYFSQDWAFTGRIRDKNGSHRRIRLFKASKLPIVRHVKVRAAANPYDPQWERYFEKRLDNKMAAVLRGKHKLLFLWLTQKGVCPVCQEKVTDQTGWQSHHIIQRVNGGDDSVDNLVLLHPTCHQQVHSLGSTVLKPRPTTGRS
jgi:DNA-binding NarL/FixJ family response regulator/5-methylcytosine-specific restriction endonuclease McrA